MAKLYVEKQAVPPTGDMQLMSVREYRVGSGSLKVPPLVGAKPDDCYQCYLNKDGWIIYVPVEKDARRTTRDS